MIRDFRWRNLGAKIIAWFFVPTAIILVAVALVAYNAYQRVTEELVIERDKELTHFVVSQLAIELEKHEDLLVSLARTSDIFHNDRLNQLETLQASSSRLEAFDGGVLILDSFGTVAVSVEERPEVMGEDWSDRPYYREILRSQILGSPEPVFSDIVMDGPGGGKAIAVAVPIIGEQLEFFGVLVGLFRLDEASISSFYDDIDILHGGDTGQTYIVDGNGLVIYNSESNRVGEDFSTHPVLSQELSEQSGAFRTRDIEGREIVASFALIQGTSWTIIIEDLWQTLTAGGRGYQHGFLLLLVMGVALPALAVAVGLRRVMRPIQDLIGAAKEVAKGNFGQNISAQTGDEIEELANQFNIMSAHLQDSYSTLERRVTDRTRELATLNAIAAIASRSLDLEEILRNALEKTLEVIEIEAGGIYLLDQDTELLKVVVHEGLSPEVVEGMDRLQIGEGFSGRVVQAGEPIVVSEISKDARLTRLAAKESGLQSIACFPLISRGEILGALFISSFDYREFSHQDIALLVSIGQQIGGAVENARLFSKADQRLRELEALYRADEELYRFLRVDQVLQALVEVALEILNADKSLVVVWDDTQDHLLAKASRGFHPDTLAKITFLPGVGTVGTVAVTGETVIVEETRGNPHVVKEIVEPEAIRSFMHVPIKIEGQIVGVFNVAYVEPTAFGDEEVRLCVALAQRAALAIENARLSERAQQTAVFEERQRLARDLHDAVTQTLFSASLIAEVLPRLWERDMEEGLRRLSELRQLTRGALAEMRTLLVELRPAALAEAALGDLLKQLAEASTGRTQVAVALDLGDERSLPVDVKVALYRIAQEGLNNVAKHSGATEVSVSLSFYPRHVELAIHDNGRGFDMDTFSPDQLGLRIMRERAESIGAALTIESETGGGTKVTVAWSEDLAEGEDR